MLIKSYETWILIDIPFVSNSHIRKKNMYGIFEQPKYSLRYLDYQIIISKMKNDYNL